MKTVQGQIDPVGMFDAVVHGRRFSLKQIICELLDNSFDAGAVNVDVESKPRFLSIRDDGQGRSDPHVFMTAGKSVSHVSTLSGRWGIGLKLASRWLEGVTDIQSISEGLKVRLKVNWGRIAKSRKWEFDVYDPLPVDVPSGTIISFSGVTRRIAEIEKVMQEMSFLFFPVLQRGRLRYRKSPGRWKTIQAWSLPPLKSELNFQFEINGKLVSVRGGLVDGKCMYPGVHVTHGHRVVFPRSAFGLSTNRLANICVWVELGEKQWKLSQIKDDIVDDDRDELEDELTSRLAALCDSASGSEVAVEIDNINLRLSERFQSCVQSKERRDIPEAPEGGTVDPVGTERKRIPKKTQPGAGRRRSRGITIVREDGSGELVGRFDKGSKKIFLDGCHDRVKRYYENGNEDALFECAIVVAMQHDLDDESDSKPLLKNFDRGMKAITAFSSFQQPIAR